MPLLSKEAIKKLRTVAGIVLGTPHRTLPTFRPNFGDPKEVHSFWAEITGTLDGGPYSYGSTCNGGYSWKLKQDVDCGEFLDPYLEGPSDRNGTLPAFEVNGKSIAAGTMVRMWRGAGDYFLFSADKTECPQTEFRFFDLKCENGKLKKYYTPITIDENGCPTAGDPIFAGEAGCCGCGGDSGSGGGGGGGGGDSGGSGGGGGGDIIIPTDPCFSLPPCGCKLQLCDIPTLTATITASCVGQSKCYEGANGSWVLEGTGSVTCINNKWKFCYNDWRRLILIAPNCSLSVVFQVCSSPDQTCYVARLWLGGCVTGAAVQPITCSCNPPVFVFKVHGIGGCFCDFDVVITP